MPCLIRQDIYIGDFISGADLDPNNPTEHISNINYDPATRLASLHGNRQDWATHLNLIQIVNKDAALDLGMGYTRSIGFLENPYKVSWIFGIDPNVPPQPDDTFFGRGKAFIEHRPDSRNQWNWNANWTQYVGSLDAALHLNYQFAHDDWGINAHTFAADWVQPLGTGWTLTPRIRYYSQDAADFYKPYFDVGLTQINDELGNPVLKYNLPQNFSSDQRLSGYGTLSGGLTLSKQFAKGLELQAGVEYYSHQGSLKLGGGREADFADFDFWVANAALKVNLASLGQGASNGSSAHGNRHSHSNIPAGVMFAHSLNKVGDMMVGYRYQHSQQAGDFLHGDQSMNESQILAKGCPGSLRSDPVDGSVHFDGSCAILPKEMTMSMHMLELMYAPTDWLSLMLMP